VSDQATSSAAGRGSGSNADANPDPDSDSDTDTDASAEPEPDRIGAISDPNVTISDVYDADSVPTSVTVSEIDSMIRNASGKGKDNYGKENL
jgi:hypothetical protein